MKHLKLVNLKNITVFGNTNYIKKFPIKYKNIDLKKKIFGSQTRAYVNKFIEIEKNNKSSIVEIHNRPSYLKILSTHLDNKIFTLFLS